MKIKNARLLLLAILLAGGMVKTYATTAGFYMGAQAGQTNQNNSEQDILLTGSSTPIEGSPDNTGIGGRIFLGYQVNSYFAIESGYTYYHPTYFSSPDLNSCSSPSIRKQSIDLLGKGIWQGSLPIALFAKGGAAVMVQKQSSSLVEESDCDSSQTTTKVVPVAGLGVSYDLSPNWVVDASWTRAFGSGGMKPADFYGIGLSYHFVDEYCGQFLC